MLELFTSQVKLLLHIAGSAAVYVVSRAVPVAGVAANIRGGAVHVARGPWSSSARNTWWSCP